MDIPEQDQKSQTAEKKYKSPKWKLIRFFENSRNDWKKKAKEAKYQIKLLRKRVKYLEQHKKGFKDFRRGKFNGHEPIGKRA